jgi:hypothetical protein
VYVAVATELAEKPGAVANALMVVVALILIAVEKTLEEVVGVELSSV